MLAPLFDVLRQDRARVDRGTERARGPHGRRAERSLRLANKNSAAFCSAVVDVELSLLVLSAQLHDVNVTSGVLEFKRLCELLIRK